MAIRKKFRRVPQEVVRQFLASNTTQKRFCHKSGVPLSTLTYWLKQHRGQVSNPDQPLFLPVEVSAESLSSQVFLGCEVEYPNGVRIHFSHPVSPSILVQLALARGL